MGGAGLGASKSNSRVATGNHHSLFRPRASTEYIEDSLMDQILIKMLQLRTEHEKTTDLCAGSANCCLQPLVNALGPRMPALVFVPRSCLGSCAGHAINTFVAARFRYWARPGLVWIKRGGCKANPIDALPLCLVTRDQGNMETMVDEF